MKCSRLRRLTRSGSTDYSTVHLSGSQYGIQSQSLNRSTDVLSVTKQCTAIGKEMIQIKELTFAINVHLNIKQMKHTFEPKDPFHLSDEEIDDLMLHSGTYEKDASEETRKEWRRAYRKVETFSNQQIAKHGGVEAWYESGEGRLI